MSAGSQAIRRKFDLLVELVEQLTKCKLTFAFVFVITCSHQGFAADLEIDRIVVTGSRLPSSSNLLIGGADVRTYNIIEKFEPVSLVNSFQRIPGLTVSQAGGPGGIPFVSLRGGDENFTLIMIDDVVVNDPTAASGGGFDFGLVDPLSVERVEVVKGPLSTIYGSGSLSGGINIITKPTERRNSILGSVYAGSRDQVGVNFKVDQSIGSKTQISARAGWSDAQGEIEGDQFERFSGGISVDLRANNGSVFDAVFNVFDVDASSFPQSSGGPRLAVNRAVEERQSRQYTSRVGVDIPLFNNVSVDFLATWSRIEAESENPGIAPGALDGVPPISSESNFDRAESLINARYEIPTFGDDPRTRMDLSAGFSYLSENGESEGIVDFGFPIPTDFKLKRKTASVFAEFRFAYENSAIFSAGVRNDQPKNAKSQTVYKFGSVLQTPFAPVSLTIDYSQGFKRPSFFALASPLVGNPNLLPEESEGLAVGVVAQFSERVSTTTSYFENEFANLVDFDPEAFTNFNRSEVKAEGLEMYGQVTISPQIQVTGTLTYTDYKVSGEMDQELRLRPSWQGSAGLEWLVSDSISAQVYANLFGRRFETVIPSGLTELQPYQTVDVNVQWRATDKFSVRLNLSNVLDQNYEEAVGFPSPGPTAFLTFAAQY